MRDKRQVRQVATHFYKAYRWSPWQATSYHHCGVHVLESSDTVIMDQADEVFQLRGLLGGIQWRAYSTAPQRLATEHASVAGVQGNNSCVERRTNSDTWLQVDPEDVVFVAWYDAAVGNRPDLSSTRGYLRSCVAISTLFLSPEVRKSSPRGKIFSVSRDSSLRR